MRIGKAIDKICKVIARTGVAAIAKTGRTSLRIIKASTVIGITAAGMAAGIRELAGTTCGMNILPQLHSV